MVFMKKNMLFLIGLIVIAAVTGFSLAGCGDSENGDPSSPGSGNNNSNNGNSGGNNNGGNSDGGDKSFSFKVKNELSGYAILRIRVGTDIDRKGLNITQNGWSDTLTKTLAGGWGSFPVNVHYDSSYPDIAAGIHVESDWPESFNLRLWNDGGTVRLSRIQ
jgi:hypothetical protein